MATIAYNDKPEYLTMWLCTILCARIQCTHLSYLEKHRSQMVTILRQHFKDNQIAAHPDTLVQCVKP